MDPNKRQRPASKNQVDDNKILFHLNPTQKSELQKCLKQLNTTKNDPKLQTKILQYVKQKNLYPIMDILQPQDKQIFMKKIKNLNSKAFQTTMHKTLTNNNKLNKFQILDINKNKISNKSEIYKKVQQNKNYQHQSPKFHSVNDLNQEQNSKQKFRETFRSSFCKQQSKDISTEKYINQKNIEKERKNVEKAKNFSQILEKEEKKHEQLKKMSTSYYIPDRSMTKQLNLRQQGTIPVILLKKQHQQHFCDFNKVDILSDQINKLSKTDPIFKNSSPKICIKFINSQQLINIKQYENKSISKIQLTLPKIQKIIIQHKQSELTQQQTQLLYYGFLKMKLNKIQIENKNNIKRSRLQLENLIKMSFKNQDQFSNVVIYQIFLPQIFKERLILEPLIDWISNVIKESFDERIWKISLCKKQLSSNYIINYLLNNSTQQVRYQIMSKIRKSNISIPTHLEKAHASNSIKLQPISLIKNQQLSYLVDQKITLASISFRNHKKNQNCRGNTYLLNKIFGTNNDLFERRSQNMDGISTVLTNFHYQGFKLPICVIDIPENVQQNIKQDMLRGANLILINSWEKQQITRRQAEKLQRQYGCETKILYRDQNSEKLKNGYNLNKLNEIYVPNFATTNDYKLKKSVFDGIRESIVQLSEARKQKYNKQKLAAVFPNDNFNSLKQKTKNCLSKLEQIEKISNSNPGINKKQNLKLKPVQGLLSQITKQNAYASIDYVQQNFDKSVTKTQTTKKHVERIKLIITNFSDTNKSNNQQITDQLRAILQKYISRIKLEQMNTPQNKNLQVFLELQKLISKQKCKKQEILKKIQNWLLGQQKNIQPNKVSLPKIIHNILKMDNINKDELKKIQNLEEQLQTRGMNKIKQSILLPLSHEQRLKQIEKLKYSKIQGFSNQESIVSIYQISNKNYNMNEILLDLFNITVKNNDSIRFPQKQNIQFQIFETQLGNLDNLQNQNKKVAILKFKDPLQNILRQNQKESEQQSIKRNRIIKSLILGLTISDILIIASGQNKLFDNRELKKQFIQCINKVKQNKINNKKQLNDIQISNKLKNQLPSVYQICHNEKYYPQMKLEQNRVKNQIGVKQYEIFPMGCRQDKYTRKYDQLFQLNDSQSQQSTPGQNFYAKYEENEKFKKQQAKNKFKQYDKLNQKISKQQQNQKRTPNEMDQKNQILLSEQDVKQKQNNSNFNERADNYDRMKNIMSSIVKKIKNRRKEQFEQKSKINIIQKLKQNSIKIQEIANTESKIKSIKNEANEEIIIKNNKIQYGVKSKFAEEIGKIEDIYNDLDKMLEEDYLLTAKICQKMMNQRLTNQKQLQHYKQFQIVKQKANNGDEISIIMLILKQIIEKQQQCKLYFSQKSNVRTQLTTRYFSTNYLKQYEKFQQKLQQNQHLKFEDIYKNNENLKNFEQWYKNGLAKDFGLIKDKIIIHKIQKGSIRVVWSTDQADAVCAKPNKRKLVIHPFFTKFQLSYEDFSGDGNRDFGIYTPNVEFRGGWPYYQPKNGKRYGLNVRNKYDKALPNSQTNRWLQMSGYKGEWVVGFHGVSSPTRSIKLIMNGLKNNQMLKPGGGQAYTCCKCINKPEQNVNNGVYLTPHFDVALQGYTCCQTVNDKKYRLVMQCRINPHEIKVCPRQDYWVINQSKNIRPYGILLVKDEDFQNYPSATDLYEDKAFTWERYKDKIIGNNTNPAG